jgi:UDPglucose 6-dehydrogenase
MKITIIGAGYVGLVSGVCLAEIGHQVICVDHDEKIISDTNNGICPIYETGLDDLLNKNLLSGRFVATTDLNSAVESSDVSIIAVGTPFDGTDIDLSFIENVSIQIGKALRNINKFHVICVKSTVTPGTTSNYVAPLVEKYSGKKLSVDFGICMNPEFLAEGTAVADFMGPDRIVIGAYDERTRMIMQQLYSPFPEAPICFTTPFSAEMGKYVANSFLATSISFTNEIAELCSQIKDTDIVDVMNIVKLDKRLSPITPLGRITPGFLSFLHPGPGYGGSCFPKDVMSLVSYSTKLGVDMEILKGVVNRNRKQPIEVIKALNKKYPNLQKIRVAVLGLSFKPETDDVRESPSKRIIELLLERGAVVSAHDPIAANKFHIAFPELNINYANTIEDAIKDVQIVIVVTYWSHYHSIQDLLNLEKVLLIDTRRFFNKTSAHNYVGIGLN